MFNEPGKSKVWPWVIQGVVVLAALAARDAASKGLRAYAEVRKKRAAATEDKKDDEREEVIGAVLHGIADRLKEGDQTAIDELRRVAGPRPESPPPGPTPPEGESRKPT